MDYVMVFIFAVLASSLLTVLLEKVSVKLGFVDVPRDRHQHELATPLLGGVAVFVSAVVILVMTHQYLLQGNLSIRHWLGFLLGALILVVGGLWDDKADLAPWQQFIFPLAAVLAVVIGGVNIEKISNPLGGYIFLATWVSNVLIAVWLLGMMYTTKLLDGLDGLVSGVGAIGSLVIFAFTMTARWYQPDIAWASLVLGGVLAGFLIRNWHPAKIFLGEAGSLLVGFSLGVLSIISGGKLAIALLIMGVPILDVAWTIARRLLAGKNPFKSPDRQHLHFRLLSAGLSVRQTALVFYVFAAIFGLLALFLQSQGKLLLLALLVVMASGLLGVFWWLDKKSNNG